MYISFELTRLSYLFVESNIVGIIILVQMIKNEIETFFYGLKWIECTDFVKVNLSFWGI
jgi:hypothetical protein